MAKMKEFEPGRGYTRADWDDAETPEATAEELAVGPSEKIMKAVAQAGIADLRQSA
ncbi:hypothetical protein GCM10010994_58870 [Chelatococcus reniformis]|uniref:Uncharacterized protein n=1 Tax=Chelatococcus reniformis TaxID=1494448 RepID=A0A916UZM3_9HYPH|nr:hypothetical protein GCM10010994_58870 [Chelatococcus reniformis]